MAKVKKKRNKKYSGVDAANNRPTVIKMQAVSRSKFGQWFYERKTIIKTGGIILLVVAAIVIVISGIVSLF